MALSPLCSTVATAAMLLHPTAITIKMPVCTAVLFLHHYVSCFENILGREALSVKEIRPFLYVGIEQPATLVINTCY